MDPLSRIESQSRPEINLEGASLDCLTCGTLVGEAHYDRQKEELRFWCVNGHESVLKEVILDV